MVPRSSNFVHAPEAFEVNVAFVAHYQACVKELANMLGDGRLEAPKCAGAAWCVSPPATNAHTRGGGGGSRVPKPHTRALHCTAQRALRPASAYPHTVTGPLADAPPCEDARVESVLANIASEVLRPCGYAFADLRSVDARLGPSVDRRLT